MHRLTILLVAACCLSIGGPTSRRSQAEPTESAVILLDDFEREPQGWKWIGGWEFPGAKGGLALDDQSAHGGRQSYRLQADFSGGGAYVGTWRDLAALAGREIKELRLWVKTDGITGLGVRVVDSSEQCHQKQIGLPAGSGEGWQPLVIKIADVVGGEHWGGANDGRWHGPATGFGLNIGKDRLEPGAVRGTLWIDDLEAVAGSAVEGRATLLAAIVDPPVCRPGFGPRVTYRWQAQPLGHDYTVAVHVVAADGRIVAQDDHEPQPSTAVWSGPTEYSHTVLLPTDTPDGEYQILVGLYDRRAAERGWDKQELALGPGVAAVGPHRDYRIGLLKVDSQAPLPKLPPATLNLDGYTLSFADEFDDLSVSAAGPGTRWFTATKENFGDARFVPQQDGFPFSVRDGILHITAARQDGEWRSGILASVDPQGKGFSQQFGYFEMRAKFPNSLGMWPAFWLLGQPSLLDKKLTNIEIDVVEHYGVHPNAIFTTQHLWPADGKHTARGDLFLASGLTDSFHNYGVLVDDKQVTWYFDGIPIAQQPTPPEAKVPLYLLIDLAMGGGWPIDRAQSPSTMDVDYVRAYAPR